MAGRKRIYDFDSMLPGQRVEATGKAKEFRYQYAWFYNKQHTDRRVRVVVERADGGVQKVYFEKESL